MKFLIGFLALCSEFRQPVNKGLLPAPPDDANPGEKPFPGKEICSRCYRADGFKEMAKGCARVRLLKYTDYRVITLLFGSE